jgi:hypothetical protein
MSDLRDALRALRATPLVTAVAVLSLALGIGATTAMFSIADALLFRALPVRHAERLTLLSGASSDSTPPAEWWTNPVWEAVRDRPALHDGAFAFAPATLNLAAGGEVDEVQALRASGRMFEVLGVRAALGRTFAAADDRRDGGPDGPVAVISHGFWQQRYGGRPDAIGRTRTLNRVPFTVVGVTPPGFFGPEVGRAFDVAVPLNTVALLNGDAGALEGRSSWWLKVMLRLAPGEAPAQATARLRAVQPQVADETRPTDQRPQDAAKHLRRPFTLAPAAVGSSELRRGYERPVLALLGAVGLTLLVACGNIANLLLARATARRHELSVRTALGATGARLARKLFAESLVLAAAGAALGVLVAAVGGRLVVAQISTPGDPVFLAVGPDWRMLAFAAAAAAGTALLFGTLPARRAARAAPIDAMRDAARGASSRRGAEAPAQLVEAGRVGEQVPRGHRGRVRAGHPHAAQVRVDVPVQADPAAVGELDDGRGRHGLRDGADAPERRVDDHRLPRLEVGDAVAPRVHDAAALDEDERAPGELLGREPGAERGVHDGGDLRRPDRARAPAGRRAGGGPGGRRRRPARARRPGAGRGGSRRGGVGRRPVHRHRGRGGRSARPRAEAARREHDPNRRRDTRAADAWRGSPP